MRASEINFLEPSKSVDTISLEFIKTAFPSALSTNDGLSVAIQPQYDLRTGKIVAAEALVRWNHPLKGNISPEKFIPVLDGLGLESALFEFVLNKVLDVLCTLRLLNIECPISINASTLLMSDPKVTENLIARLEQAGIAPRLVNIEITEDKETPNLQVLASNLTHLREYGFAISIDDFGTGHSTLQRLISLPFSQLKIDRVFVSRMLDCASARAIVISSLELGRKLGLSVVAEGIESGEQVGFLRKIGCWCGQGFGLSRPLKIRDFITRLVRNTENTTGHVDVTFENLRMLKA